MSALQGVASQLLANGYSIIPKKPASAVPTVKGAGEFSHRRATEREVAQWFKRTPDLGLALAAGSRFGYLIIDCDCSNRELSRKILHHLRDAVGSKFPTRVGRAPKWAGLVRCHHHINTAQWWELEIFGSRGDVMAYGLHRKTGEPYVWSDGSPADVPVSELPEITLEALERFVKLAKCENPKPKASKSRSKGRKGSRTTQRPDFDFKGLKEQRRGLKGDEYSKCIEAQLAAMEDGNRSNTLISVIGSLVRRGFRDAQILWVLREPYLQRCQVEWSDITGAEALKQVKDMIKRARARQAGGTRD